MSGMWRRWARTRRLIGLSFLGTAAVAFAVAVLLFSNGHGFFSGVLAGAALGLASYAGVEFAWAFKYSRLEN